MRDNAEGLPEILDAFERENHCFCRVRLTLGGDSATYQFGVSRSGYHALRRVLEFRPFDSLPGQTSRVFFVPSYRFTEPGADITSLCVRVEQGKWGKQFEFDAPLPLVQNLKWFQELKSADVAKHLLVE